MSDKANELFFHVQEFSVNKTQERVNPQAPQAQALAMSGLSQASIVEAAITGMTLSLIAVMSGSKLTDWMGATAVFITFLHWQMSYSMQESLSTRQTENSSNYHWSARLFVAKEVLWLVTFALSGCYPLCAGSLLFATYPRWRAWTRRENNETK